MTAASASALARSSHVSRAAVPELMRSQRMRLTVQGAHLEGLLNALFGAGQLAQLASEGRRWSDSSHGTLLVRIDRLCFALTTDLCAALVPAPSSGGLRPIKVHCLADVGRVLDTHGGFEWTKEK